MEPTSEFIAWGPYSRSKIDRREANQEHIGLLAIQREGFTQTWSYIAKQSALSSLNSLRHSATSCGLVVHVPLLPGVKQHAWKAFHRISSNITSKGTRCPAHPQSHRRQLSVPQPAVADAGVAGTSGRSAFIRSCDGLLQLWQVAISCLAGI